MVYVLGLQKWVHSASVQVGGKLASFENPLFLRDSMAVLVKREHSQSDEYIENLVDIIIENITNEQVISLLNFLIQRDCKNIELFKKYKQKLQQNGSSDNIETKKKALMN